VPAAAAARATCGSAGNSSTLCGYKPRSLINAQATPACR
jgi:hypothetical protein